MLNKSISTVRKESFLASQKVHPISSNLLMGSHPSRRYFSGPLRQYLEHNALPISGCSGLSICGGLSPTDKGMMRDPFLAMFEGVWCDLFKQKGTDSRPDLPTVIEYEEDLIQKIQHISQSKAYKGAIREQIFDAILPFLNPDQHDADVIASNQDGWTVSGNFEGAEYEHLKKHQNTIFAATNSVGKGLQAVLSGADQVGADLEDANSGDFDNLCKTVDIITRINKREDLT